MPKLPPNRVPSYRHHKASGQGVVTLDGKDHYLGPYEPKAKPGPGRAAYAQLTGEWLAGGRKLPKADAPAVPEHAARADADKGTLTVSQLVLLYWRHAQVYYRKGGKPTSEQSCIKLAMRPLKRLYGRTRAADFGPRALKEVRQAMVDAKLERKSINRHVGRIRRMFKWASEDELVPAVVFHALQTVQGLKSGRSEARETRPGQTADPRRTPSDPAPNDRLLVRGSGAAHWRRSACHISFSSVAGSISRTSSRITMS